MSNLDHILNPQLLDQYFKELEQSDTSSATINRKKASLNQFQSWAKDHGYINNSPLPPLNLRGGSRGGVKRIYPYAFLTLGLVAVILLLLNWRVPNFFNLLPKAKEAPAETVIVQEANEYSPPYPFALEAGPLTVPVINADGSLVLAGTAPKIKALNDTFAIEGQAIVLQTPFASDGNITLAPDGAGEINLRAATNIENANLTTGNLITGYVGNDTTSYDFIEFQGGATPQTRFRVDALGRVYLTGLQDQNLSSPINLSDATHTSLPTGATSILGGIQAAFDASLHKNGLKLYDPTGSKYLSLSHDGTNAIITTNPSTGQLQLQTDVSITEGVNITGILDLANNLFIQSQNDLRLADADSSHYTGFQAPSTIPANLIYTLPSADGSPNYILATNGSSTLSWIDATSISGALWTVTNGGLYPVNPTVDLLIGGTSTTSAKFAFINVGSGTPTATISAGTAGGIYLTADGTLSTTTLQTLTLGSATTGNLVLAPNGAAAATLTNSSNDLVIDSAGGQINLANGDVFNVGGITGAAYTAFSDSGTASTASTDDDVYVEDILEVDGTFDLDGAFDQDGTSFSAIVSAGQANAIELIATAGGIDISTGSGTADIDILGGDAVNIKAAGGNINLSSGTISAQSGLVLDTSGNVTLYGDLAVNGDDITSDGALTLNAATYVRVGDSGTPGLASGDDDLYVEGDLEVDAILDLDGSLDMDGTTFDVSNTGAISLLTSSGTANAIQLVASAGGIDISTGSGSQDIDILGGLGVNLKAVNADITLSAGSTTYTSGLVVDSATGYVGVADASPASLFTVGSGDALQIDNSGNLTTSGDIAVNGDDITSDGALTLNAATYVRVGDTGTPGLASGDDDLYVEGDLEVDAVLDVDGSFDMDGTTFSVNASAGQANAIELIATAGGIDISTGSGTGDIDILGGDAVNLKAVGGNLNLSSGTSTAQSGVVLDTSGNLTAYGTIVPAGGIIRRTSGNILIDTATAGDVTIGPDVSLGTGDDLFFQDGTLAAVVPLTVADTALNGNLGQGIIDAINDAYDAAVGAAGGIWTTTNEIIYPSYTWRSVAIGGSATSSAKLYFDATTGNSSQSGSLTFDAATNIQSTKLLTLTIGGDTTGNLVLAPNGATAATLTNSSNDLVIDSTGGQINLANGDVFNIGGVTGTAYTAFSDSGTASTASTDDDVYIEDILEVDGTIDLDGAFDQDGTTFDVNNTGAVSLQTSSGTANAIQLVATTGGIDISTGSGTADIDILGGDAVNIKAVGSDLSLSSGSTSYASGLVVDSATGYVGVGDASPVANLVVGSDAGAGTANGIGDVYIQNDLEIDGILDLDGSFDMDGTTFDVNNTGALSLQTSSGTANAIQLVATTGGIDISTGSGSADIDILSGDALNLKAGTNGITLSTATFTLASGFSLNGTTGLAAFGSTATAGTANGAGDVYVERDLEVDGTIYGNLVGSIDLDFTQGSVLFADSNGAIAQDNANFYWDDTNNRLGLGDATPDDRLDVESSTLGYNFLFGTNGVTLSTSGTSGINIDTFGQLSLTGNQGAANAVEIVSTAGGIDISTGSGTQNIDILSGNAINLIAKGSDISLSSGTLTYASGLVVDSGTGYIGLGDASPVANLVVGSDAGAGTANGIGDAYIQNDLEIDAILDLDGSLDMDGTTFDVNNTGAISLQTSSGTANAIQLVASAGGIDISTGSGSADIDILSGDAVNLRAGTNGITFSAGTSTAQSGISIDTSSNLIINAQGDLRLMEATANGSNYTGFQAPASLAGDVVYTLPTADAGASGYALTSNGSGTLSWTDISTGGSAGPWTLSGNDLYPDSTAYNVGIGTTSPDDKFQVENTSLGYNFLFGSNGITLSTSGTSGINVDTFGQLSFTTNQGAANALELVSTTGGIDISTGSSTGDIDILGGASINLTAREAAADAIVIAAPNKGGIDLSTGYDTGSGQNIDILGGLGVNLKAVNADLTLSSGTLTYASGLVVDSATGYIGLGDASPLANLVVGSDAGAGTANGIGDAYIQNDLEIDGILDLDGSFDMDGTTFSAIVSAGQANAIELIASAGGIDISTGSGSADIDILGGDAVNIKAVGGNLNLSSGTISAQSGLVLDTSGNVTLYGDLAVNGDDITSDGALTLNATTYVRVGDSGTPGLASGDDDLYVEGDLEVDAILDLDGSFDMDGTSFDVLNTGAISLQTSSGTANAIQLVATAGGIDISTGGDTQNIDILSGNDINITATDVLALATTGAAGQDITIINTGGSVIIRGTESAADAIFLDANDGTAGGLDIDTGTGGIDADGTGPVSFNTSVGQANAIELVATAGGIDISTGSGSADIDILGGDAVNIKAVGGNLNLSSGTISAQSGLVLDTSGNVTLYGDLAVNGDDITSDGALTLNATTYVRVGDSGTPGLASGDDDLYVEGDLEIDAILDLDGSFDMDGTTFDVSNTGAVSLLTTSGTANAIQLVATAGGIDISTGSGSADIDILGGDVINLKAVGGNINLSSGTSTAQSGLVLDTSGNLTAYGIINATGGTIRRTSGNLTLSTVTSGDLSLTAAGELYFSDNGATNIPLTLTDTSLSSFPSGDQAVVDALNYLYNASSGSSGGLWTAASGTIYVSNTTQDVLVGGTATSSAKFAFINTNTGTPTATVSAGAAGGTYLTAAGTLATTTMQTLTIGSSTTGNVNINSTGDMTLDSSTDIIFDADGADIYFKDATTTFATFTNSSTDLTLDIAGGQFLLADTDVLNIGGVSGLAYTAFADSGGSAGTASTDNDVYIQDILEVDGTINLDGVFDQDGSTFSSIVSAGQANAIELIASAGGIDISTGSGSADIDILSGDAINLRAGTNGITFSAGTSTAQSGLSIDTSSNLIINAQGDLRLLEATANGTNYTGFQAPASLAGDVLYTLPTADAAAADYALVSNSSGTLSWKEIAGVGGVGDITAVGSMTSGVAFGDSGADDDWLGLGATAGRIEFDDQTVDEINFLSARVGIGDATPDDLFDVEDANLGYNFLFGSNGITLSTSGTSGINTDSYGQISFTTNKGAADALELVSTAGGIDISTGSGTADIDILGGDVINLKAVGGNINLSSGTVTRQSGLAIDTSGNVTAYNQFRVGSFSANPTSMGTGAIVYRTDDNNLYYDKNGTWTQVGSGAGGSNWTISNGSLYPINETLDLLIGGTSSASAKFAVVNVNSGTPTASISGNLTLASQTAAPTITSTAGQDITLDASGTKVIVADDLQVNGGDIRDSAGSIRLTLSNSQSLTQVNEFLSVTRGATLSAAIATDRPLTLKDTAGSTLYYVDNSANIYSGAANGSTAIGFTFDTANSLSTQGAKIASFKTGGTEKFYIDKDGNLYAAGTILSGNGQGMLMTNKSGGTVAVRSLVIIDTSNNSAFTTTTTAYAKTSFGVLTGVGLGVTNDADGDGACDANDICMIAVGGEVNVTASNAATATKGDYLYTSATAGSAVASAKQFDGLIGVVSSTADSGSGYLKMIFKVQPQVTASAAIDKGLAHTTYRSLADTYARASETERYTQFENVSKAIDFDSFVDEVKYDSANSTVPIDANKKRVGLYGGRTLNNTNTDTSASPGPHSYLGANDANDVYYYDRTQSGNQGQDSTPSVLVNLGVDPNWYNGVSLVNVATGSGALTSVPPPRNLSTTYNGGLIKVTGRYAASAEHGWVDVTVRSISTTALTARILSSDWSCDVQSASLSFGSEYSLTSGGCSASTIKITSQKGNYQIGDTFRISSWYLEPQTANDRGPKQAFPERSYLVASDDNLDILDADTTKLWMRFSQGTNQALGAAANNTPSAVHALNGRVYLATNGSSATGLYTLAFFRDSVYRTDATDWRASDKGVIDRNTTNTYSVINTRVILQNVAVNDVHANVVQTATSPSTYKMYAAAAEDTSLTVIHETDAVAYSYSDVSADDYNAVWLTSGGELYGLNETQAQAEKWNNVHADTASELAGTPDNANISATGGTITNSGGYTIHTFNSSGTFTPAKAGNVEYLVVGGGGAGGSWYGGGGGGGGYTYNSSYAVTAGEITVTVGAGGTSSGAATTGNDGQNSVFGTITSTGGGGGGGTSSSGTAGRTGGSGGGGNFSGAGGSGTGTQGSQGGNGGNTSGGGGGGAGQVGSNGSLGTPGAGGNGVANSISGSSITYAGGGGAWGDSGSSGGAGGGGNGGNPGTAGTANTGGGGGGTAGGNPTNAGGSGIVIIRYLTSIPSLTASTPTIQASSPDALSVTEATSTINGTSDTLYVTTNLGLSVIQDKAADEANSSVKYYTKDYISEDLIGDIRAMWPLNNANASSDFEDVSVKANNLTGTNVTANGDSVTGVRATATDLDGSTESLTIADDADLDFAAADTFAVGIWARHNGAIATNEDYLITKADATTGGYKLYMDNSGDYCFAIDDDATWTPDDSACTSAIDYDDSLWHHIVGVKNGTTAIRLYVDGVEVANDTTIAATATLANTNAFYIGVDRDGTSNEWDGGVDEAFVTAENLSAAQIKRIYEVGKRALEGSHATNDFKNNLDEAGTGTGGTNVAKAVAVDFNNKYAYVGLDGTGADDGWVSKIDLGSDTQTDQYTTTTDPSIADNDVTALGVGYDLEIVGNDAIGARQMSLDSNGNNATGNYVSRTLTTPVSFTQAYIWTNSYIDADDSTSAITVQASNDGGSTYVTGTLTNTDSNQDPTEREYFFQFSSAGSSLKVRLQFARDSTKLPPIYTTRWGIAWIGSDALGGAPGGNGLYTNNNASVANGSYLEVAHNQNSNDLLSNGWVYNTAEAKWQQIDNSDPTNGYAFGNGADGAITVTASKNLNTDTIASGRTYADGIAYKVDTNLPISGNSLTTSDTPSGLAAGDEVLLINLQGASGDTGDIGKYEFLRIAGITSKQIFFNSNIQKTYTGTTASNQKIVIQRIPQYTSVTLSSSGSLTASAWEALATTPTGAAGYLTGIVAFRATGTVTVGSGTSITANNLGFAGGTGNGSTAPGGSTYNGTAGAGGTSDVGGTGQGGGGGGKGGAANAGGAGAVGGGGGGGGISYGGGGGGGGYGAVGSGGTGGTNGTTGATGSSGSGTSGGTGGTAAGGAGGGGGGGSYGTANLSTLFLGSGGGAGGPGSTGGTGGNGGGIILISANSITNSSSITSNGQDGTFAGDLNTGGGGGGSGGSVYLVGSSLTLGSSTVTASAGSGHAGGAQGGTGGNGGAGRIRVEYTGTLSGTTSPTASTATTLSSQVFPQNGPYVIKQQDANTVRLYNYSGAAQNLRLDVITGGLGRNAGTVSLAPAAADTQAQDNTNAIWINQTGANGALLKLQRGGTDILNLSQRGGDAAMILDQRLSGDIFTASASGTPRFTIGNSGGIDSDATGQISFTTSQGAANSLELIANSGGIDLSTGSSTQDIDILSGDAINLKSVGGAINLSAGSPTVASGITLATTGNVGIGITGPEMKLHLNVGSSEEGIAIEGSAEPRLYLASDVSSGTEDGYLVRHVVADNSFEIGNRVGGNFNSRFYINTSGNVGIGDTTPTEDRLVVRGGAVSGEGVYTNLSSHSSLKEGFKDVFVLDKISQLNIKEWQYNASTSAQIGDTNRHLYPFADDFYAQFALAKDEFSINALDVAGVAIKGVQELEQRTKGLETTGQGDLTINRNVGIGTTGPESKLQVSGGGLCVGSDANCNTDNNTEGIVYSSSTAMSVYDVAENYPTRDTTLSPGEVVELDPANGVFVRRSSPDSPYSRQLLGIISTAPGVLLGGFNGAQFKEEHQVAVALSGRVPVKIDPDSQPIAVGDFLTSSDKPGLAMKATKAGYTVGKALENWGPSTSSGRIETFVSLGYYAGELTAVGFLPEIQDLSSNIYVYPEASPSASLITFVKDNWDKLSKANFDIINSLVAKTKTLIVEDTFISPLVETERITTAGKDLVIDLTNSPSEESLRNTSEVSEFGTLIVKGNASVSGQLDANSLAARRLDVDTIQAGTISAKYIKADHIEGLEAKFGLISNDLEATLSALLASQVASQGHPLQGQGVALPDPDEAFLDANAGFFREFLAVTGKTSLTDTEIATSLVVGSSLALDHNSISNLQCSTSEESINNTSEVTTTSDNRVPTCDNTLYIQPTGQGRISLLADLMTLDDTGQVTITGNLSVTGQLTVGGVPSATPEVLTIKSGFGDIVASIDASGAATFTKLVIATPGDHLPGENASHLGGEQASASAEVRSNASVGIATLAAGFTEAKIPNTQVTLNSLIYLTPTTTTYNQVLYLKTKKAGTDFTVAIDQPISTDIEFQYWIIN